MTTKPKPKPRKKKPKPRFAELAKRKTAIQRLRAKMTLKGNCESVLLSKDVTPEYSDKVRYCVRSFCDWLGYDPEMSELDPDDVNEYLQYMQDSGRRPDTVLGYRRALLLIWNEAYRNGEIDTPPVRIRRIRTYRDPVEAFTLEELQTLIRHVGSLSGHFPNGAKRKDLWLCLILSAYGTALRRGDLLRVRRCDVTADGVCRVRQNKTGYPVTVRFPAAALEARDRMSEVVDERMIPWPYHSNSISRQFRAIAKAAGIRPGQFRWLRRSGGSYADLQKFGDGSLLLGHRDRRMFNAHYECQHITRQEPVAPPEIAS